MQDEQWKIKEERYQDIKKRRKINIIWYDQFI